MAPSISTVRHSLLWALASSCTRRPKNDALGPFTDKKDGIWATLPNTTDATKSMSPKPAAHAMLKQSNFFPTSTKCHNSHPPTPPFTLPPNSSKPSNALPRQRPLPILATTNLQRYGNSPQYSAEHLIQHRQQRIHHLRGCPNRQAIPATP